MNKAKTVKEVLVATKWILEHFGWCQGDTYRDKSGVSCPPNRAKSSCLEGALQLVEIDYSYWRGGFSAGYSVLVGAYDLLEKRISGKRLTNWNDEPKRTKKQVLALLDKAIKQA
jgi:hypothetical protein